MIQVTRSTHRASGFSDGALRHLGAYIYMTAMEAAEILKACPTRRVHLHGTWIVENGMLCFDGENLLTFVSTKS